MPGTVIRRRQIGFALTCWPALSGQVSVSVLDKWSLAGGQGDPRGPLFGAPRKAGSLGYKARVLSTMIRNLS
jgi:hypothetical protein